MFGRRRRIAPVIQPAAPELSDEQIHELIHGNLAQLIGSNGSWTLVPRSDDDTDVIFHDLKVDEIAASLTSILATGKAVLRGEREAEPTALPWTPVPISIWAEPNRATVTDPIQPVSPVEVSEEARLVA
ncbi:MAG TPA: hypothetical protein VEX88_04855 [Glaciibacter sp.]|nr:hypothetical protein [Glaciibacter sp.]